MNELTNVRQHMIEFSLLSGYESLREQVMFFR